jgi:formate hydrogenlyase subunit 3/multisubunit Na+/H+ antiporter MnhD subunit
VAVDRRPVLALVTIAAVALAAAPAVVVFSAGWLSLTSTGDGAAQRIPEAWALFALFYLVWMLGLTVLLIVANDRLGRHWQSWDRAPRDGKKPRRRREAGLKYLAGQEKARSEAPRAPRDEAPH